MTNTGGYQPSSAVETGRQWLQRWVTASVLSVAEAQRIDMFEAQRALAAYAPDPLLDGSMPEGLAAIVDSWVYRWAVSQLITEAQRASILADTRAVMGMPTAPPVAPHWTPEAPPTPAVGAPVPPNVAPPVGVPGAAPAAARPGGSSSGLAILSEVLGYSGAALAIGGSVFLMRNVWPTVPGVAQFFIAVIGVVIFGGLGAFIKTDAIPAFKRLRAVVWLSATVIGGGVGAVIATQLYDPVPVANALFFIALASAIVSAALWAVARHPVQETTLMAAVLVAIPTGIAIVAPVGLAGVFLWFAAIALLVLGMTRLLPVPPIPIALGAVALPVSLILIMAEDLATGLVIACLNALVLLVLAFLKAGPRNAGHRVALGVTGFVIAAFAVPVSGIYFAQEAAVQTGLAFIIVGVIVLGVSLADQFRDRDLVDVLCVVTISLGILLFAFASLDVTPNLGLAATIALLVLGIRLRRTGLTIVSWISVAGFALFEVIWIGRKVNVGAMIAVILGAVICAVAVVLSRKATRNAKRAKDPGQ